MNVIYDLLISNGNYNLQVILPPSTTPGLKGCLWAARALYLIHFIYLMLLYTRTIRLLAQVRSMSWQELYEVFLYKLLGPVYLSSKEEGRKKSVIGMIVHLHDGRRSRGRPKKIWSSETLQNFAHHYVHVLRYLYRSK